MSFLDKIAPDAREHFDSLGFELLAHVHRRSERSKKPKQDTDWSPATIPVLNIDGRIIRGPIRVERVDAYTQKENRIEWSEGDGVAQIENEGLSKFQKVSQGLAGLKQICRVAHSDSIRSYVLEWISSCRSLCQLKPLTEFVCLRVVAETHWHELFVPIAELVIQRSIRFAGVELVPFDASVLTLWQAKLIKKFGISEDDAQLRLTRVREIAGRGHGAVKVSIEADERLAQERAHGLAVDVCGLLRYFWDGNRVLGSRCYLMPYGLESLPQKVIFRERADGDLGYCAQLEGPPPEALELTDREMSRIKEMGWEPLSAIAASNKRNAFEQHLYSALQIYSKNCLHVELLDRVIAVLVSLESMLIRDTSEPIQLNLGWRLALVVESTPEKRRELIEAVKRCYDIRSKYIHHGVTDKGSIEHASVLLRAAWKFFFICIRSTSSISSMAAFFESIENSRISAPSVDFRRHNGG